MGWQAGGARRKAAGGKQQAADAALLPFAPRLLPLVLFLLALLPRLLAIGRYVTPDELMWVQRSVALRQALLAGDWAGTIVTGHPGVTTTWLGALGISLQLWLRPSDAAVYTWITHLAWMTPDNVAAFQQLATFLSAGRLMVALANSAGLALAYLLARPLWGKNVALLAILLLALDPFVAGLSGLLHVDGLLMTFSLLALLALARALDGKETAVFWWTAVSGVCAALALLSKSPGVLLLPLVALALLWVNWRHPARLLRQGVAWVAGFGAAALLVLPALWAAPLRVVQLISGESGRQIDEALHPTFFLGEVAFDHGPLFYPVALAFRLGPLLLPGLLLAVYAFFRRAKEHGGARRGVNWQLSIANSLFLLWALFFIIALSLAGKKFDRYALPAIPALTLLAAWGWAQAAVYWPRLATRRWLAPGLLLAQAAYLLAFAPYLLLAFNPLLGGPWVAQRVTSVGWGEGIGMAARWLAERPSATQETAVAGILPALAPFFPGQTLPDTPEGRAQADYLIVTQNGRQLSGGNWQPPVPGAELLHTIRFGGLEQARIYRNPAPQPPPNLPQAWPQPLTLGETVQLWGLAARPESDGIAVYAQWGLAAPTFTPFFLKLTLQDTQGQAWSSLETALVNDVYFYPPYWQPDEQPVVRYALPLPKGLPPGNYLVALALFDAREAQLAVRDGAGRFVGVVVQSEPVAVPPRAQVVAPPPAAPVPLAFSWLDEGLWLYGRSPLPDVVLTGGKVTLDLYWQGQRPLPAGLLITLTLAGRVVAQQPLSRYDTGQWRAGEVVQEKLTFVVPADLAAGQAGLMLQVGQGNVVTLDTLTLQETKRLFTLPDEISLPLEADFGGVLALRGLNATEVRPGATAVITFYWQAQSQPAALYTVFAHLLDANEQIVTQSDQWPGGLPSDGYLPGEVIVDVTRLDIPATLPPGEYRLRVGVYTAVDGRRLPVEDGEFIMLPIDVKP